MLLAGIPATGKSTFGKWISKEKRFRHEDLEQHQNHLEWLERKSPHAFIDELRAGRPDFLMNWGFPPNDHCFAKVQGLVDAGMTPWWFDGDRGAAHASFIRRGTVSTAAWDVQLAQIENRWADIEDIFGANRIDVIGSDGAYLSCDEIYEVMFGSE
ncbi:MAG: hypothetical protein ACLQPH_06045 [Acidimicrobiales bacterium]